MPTFGSFETIGSPHAETQARHHLNTIWRARKTGTEDGPIYAIKVYTPARLPATTSQGEHDLDADPCLEFIETIKQHKKASETSPGLLVPIHEFGAAPEGAWYATDFYRRGSLEVWVNLRGKVDSAALHNVVASTFQSCKLLKETLGRSHGNLKISNVFLGGKSQPLGKTPLLLAEPQITPMRNIASLQGRDRQTVQGMIQDTFEAQDLRMIGELIWQLVIGRLIASAADYNYPVERTKEWERLGRDGEKWRKLCEDLVNPHLSLETLNLNVLSSRFQLSSRASIPWLAITLVAGVCVVGGAGYYFRHAIIHKHPIIHKNLDQEFAAATAAGQKALQAGDYEKALQQAQLALGLKPGDDTARQLQATAQARQTAAMTAAAAQNDADYTNAITAGQAAYQSGNFDEASRQAGLALVKRPGDDTATRLERAVQAKAAVAAQNDADYTKAITAGLSAYQSGSYNEASRQARVALTKRPGDETAVGLDRDAQAKLASLAQNDADYTKAITAGQAAYQSGNYKEASRQAELALMKRPADDAATLLDQQAQTKAFSVVQNDAAYRKAIAAGQAALDSGDFKEASRQAEVALMKRPGDDAAARLQRAAQAKAAVAAQNDADYTAAITAGLSAFQSGNYREAGRQARVALMKRPGDDAAARLDRDAQAKAASAAQNDADYTNAITSGQAAYQSGKYDEASRQAGLALMKRPGDDAAARLDRAAQAKVALAAQNDAAYTNAIAAGLSAFQSGNYNEASRQARVALTKRPRDDTATQLDRDAQTKALAIQNDADYTNAITAGLSAFQSGNYKTASQQAEVALAKRPGDDAATRLDRDAQARALAVQNDADYTNAIRAGQAAYQSGNYNEASRQARVALTKRPGDNTATQMDHAAQTKALAVRNDEDYTNAIAAGQAALRSGNYKEASEQAAAALTKRPGDAVADQLSRNSQAEIDKQSAIGRLDRQLEDFMKEFNVPAIGAFSAMETKAGFLVIDPKRSKKPRLNPSDVPAIPTDYLNSVTSLEKQYNIANSYTDDRKAYIKRLKDQINSYAQSSSGF